MGGDEYFSNGICLIEWGEMIESILPKHYTKITFKKNRDLWENVYELQEKRERRQLELWKEK